MTDIPTRIPTGKPAWPITLLAGSEGAGKSFTAAQASASPLVSRTLWLGFGELDPDEYRNIPGANFEILDHPGTVKGAIATLNKIAALPEPADGPILVVFDSGSRYWDTIGEGVQHAKAAQRGSDSPADTNDLWNAGKGDWQLMLDALRRHNGPSIITARYIEDAVYVDGRATGQRAWKIKAEKGLVYDVDIVIEMKQRGGYMLTKASSLAMQFTGAQHWDDFTMDALWREMGLAEDAGERTYAKPIADTGAPLDKSGRNWLAELKECVSSKQVTTLMTDAIAARNVDRSTLAAIRAKAASLSPTVIPAAE